MSDEMRRFFRYVTPGLVYGVVTLVLLFIVLPDFTIGILNENKDSLGVAVIGFLASNGFGYVFAAIHHWVRWNLPCDRNIFDHRPIAKELRSSRRISIGHGEDIISRKHAEVVSLAYCYSHFKSDDFGQKQVDSLGNQAHGLGTARVASFFAVVTVAFIVASNHEMVAGDRGLLALLVGVAAILVFHDSYRRVAYFSQEVYNKIIRNSLYESPKKRRR